MSGGPRPGRGIAAFAVEPRSFRSSVQKLLHRLLVTEARRLHERRHSVDVGRIDLGPRLEEKLHHLHPPELRRERERRGSASVRGVGIGALLE